MAAEWGGMLGRGAAEEQLAALFFVTDMLSGDILTLDSGSEYYPGDMDQDMTDIINRTLTGP